MLNIRCDNSVENNQFQEAANAHLICISSLNILLQEPLNKMVKLSAHLRLFMVKAAT
jgi:hypothetical protein